MTEVLLSRAGEKSDVYPSAAPVLYRTLHYGKIKKGQITSLLYDTSGYPLAAERAQERKRQREMEKEIDGPSVLTALNQNIAPLFVSQSRGVMDVV